MLVDDDGTRKSAAEVFAKISAAFRKADYRSLPVMWACLAGFYWLKVIRWKFLLEPLGKFRPVRELFPATIIGFAFNNVLPAHLGEFVRVFVFSRQTRLPRTAVLTSIVLERVFDVIAILTFLALGLFLADLGNLDPKYVQTAWVLGGGVCVALIGAAIYLIWTQPVLSMVSRTLDLLPFVPLGLRDKVMGILETAAGGLASLRSPRLLSGILATSFVQWILNGLTIHLALWAFGIHVPFAVSAIVLGVTAIGVTVPASPGYFGVIQGCFLLVLNLFGAEREVVFAASIYYHMLQWVPVTLIGMFFFSRAGLKLADIEERAEDESPQDAAAG